MTDAENEFARRKKAVFSMQDSFKSSFPEVPHVSVQELHNLLSSNTRVIVLDVRNSAEQKVSVIPGSTTPEEFQKEMASLKDQIVVCYCTVGYRSSQYAQKLRAQGLDARNLEGSILAWTHAGYPLVKGDARDQETKEVHVFNNSFELQAEGYTAIKFNTAESYLRAAGDMASMYLPKWLGGKS